MASGILVNIQEEVTCPICLELLTEPCSLDCGHTFCQACITANNKESRTGQEGESSCPVCRVSYQPENLRRNQLVSNIVERLREVKLSPEMEQKENLCARHGEILLLFCKEDGKVICWLCERSQEHRGHRTCLLEEVAQEYQGKLQAILKRLREEQREAENFEMEVREEITAWKHQMENERQNVQAEFKELRAILNDEEQKELQKLKDDVGGILRNLADSENEVVQQSQLVRDLISDLEQCLQRSMVEMLQDVHGIIKRSETLTLKKPKTFPKGQRRVFRAPELRQILRAFDELRDVQRYWVPVTLIPPKRKSNVVISADGRRMSYVHTFGQSNAYLNGDYQDPGVLGSPFITRGKHYWEVDVSQKRAWILGVCDENQQRNCMRLLSQEHENYQPVCLQYQPKCGYCVIGLQNYQYYAFAQSPSSDPLKIPLSLSVPPRLIGVFLDYDARTVSFFNVTNNGSLIYKFSSCSFPQKLYPYFNLMKCEAPMTLCSIGS
ncbi:tripartite motif-containing protein 5-like isoform X1 [Camelus dromedarius]|uniref:tripartite motif-containing protein 5-like isoform X1 n=1 Tax=Camelus dromedarius TaxID=9838 RepID=UPI00311912EC